MFHRSSIPYYDKIYSSQGKDYRLEAAYVLDVARSCRPTIPKTLLDVACGTGRHLEELKGTLHVEGVDVSGDFLSIARKRNPDVTFYQGDMRTFRTGKTYDVVSCLFSSIGYMTGPRDLQRAIVNMSRHLTPEGILLVEPWFPPDQWIVGKVSMTVVEEKDLKIVRMSTAGRKGSVSYFQLHYLVGTPVGTKHFVEMHRSGLFTNSQMIEAFTLAGLSPRYDEHGPTGRGFYIGLNTRKAG